MNVRFLTLTEMVERVIDDDKIAEEVDKARDDRYQVHFSRIVDEISKIIVETAKRHESASGLIQEDAESSIKEEARPEIRRYLEREMQKRKGT